MCNIMETGEKMGKKRLFFLLFLIIFLTSKHAFANDDGSIITVTSSSAAVYDNRTGSLVKMGELLQGETYRVIQQYGENWYEIVFADSTGFVPRIAVKEVAGGSLINEKSTEFWNGDSFKTLTEHTVYDNSRGTLIPFAKISSGVQYPMLGVAGNWYKIEVAGRIGFVYKDNTELVGKPYNTKEKAYEVTSDKVDIFDNRTGTLVKVGELFKGHAFKITRQYGENWYEITYGDRTGYISRGKIKESVQSIISNENKYYMPLGDLVQITTDTTVLDNSTGALVPFASISKNTIYPILSNNGNWYTIDVAGKIGFIPKKSTILLPQKIKTNNTSKIPVLMYHHLLQREENIFPKNNVIINLENFREQLNYLFLNGYQTISLADMEAYIKGSIKLKDKTVLITFDDGLKTNHLYALPVLKQYGYQAGAFIITGRITDSPSTFNPHTSQSLSVPEMNEMKTNFQFGSHTAALHQLKDNISYVLLMDSDVILDDFITSKVFLQTNYFCYPFGKYNQDTINLLKKAGYTSAYTTQTGYAKFGINPYEIPRFGIYPGTSMSEFARIVSGEWK